MGERVAGPAYFAVITGPVLDDRVLSDSAKLLYGRITSMTDRKGYCWATNSYLSELSGYGLRTITRLIAQLEERGHVWTETVPAPKTGGRERRIYIGERAARGLTERDETGANGGLDKIGEGSQFCLGGIAKNGETLLNSLINKQDNIPPISPTEVWSAINDYIGDDDEYRAAFEDFLRNRKAMKKPVLTARAINAIINRLRKVNHRETEISMLTVAVEKNWLTVYPLRPDELPKSARTGSTRVVEEEGVRFS